MIPKLAMAVCCALLAPAVAAAAENSIQAGHWKVTTNTTMNGGTLPPQVKARCLSAEQAGDVGKTFGPTIGTVNSNCERTEFEATGQKLKWRLKCTGQMDMDVAGVFNFDSLKHYTAIILTKGVHGWRVDQRRENRAGRRVCRRVRVMGLRRSA